MAAARPMVTVQAVDGSASTEQIALPAVFSAPLRSDIVVQVHTGMNKNARQPYAVKFAAGMQTSAESWGTGRAVSRIPRVPGGGTHRAGQGAFGNMCRGGRMFAPNKTWRRWHRKINVNLKRYAVCSALAATAVPALVMARGHKVDQVAEMPLVVSNDAEGLKKTSKALAVMAAIGAQDDTEKARASVNLRRGKGKMRNRRYIGRKGPLVVYASDEGISKAFRNLPGVELACVDRLNLLQLAPGGHFGRFVIYTKAAMEKLDSIFGTTEKESDVKKGFKVPRNMMSNPDVTRVINSDEIQSIVRQPKEVKKGSTMKKNPLKNLGAMIKLNPYAKTARRHALLLQAQRSELKQKKLENMRNGVSNKLGKPAAVKQVGKDFIAALRKEHDYAGPDYEVFSNWLGNDA
uniref:Large ribosomal subunit protein uL4 C-terminal domain-containing protein n=1 Tax=Tetraselmis chuii TaxID=63592 RepID=A0A7S1T0J2_9CHLO|eukprot:CAMPEP_0168624240 /NCGR_PEP_ID=MMETSP0449_2-20121227/9293_1 /TAXON_ID=1082188 /ORGANISM="Strombidium rassoulzadegani, Strain ras09" /LENGTH=404 /DNA_ID=CAMNT_0008665755 /DNA_START=41 /DNA_END=1255 /DNA_ORIENTATION=+